MASSLMVIGMILTWCCSTYLNSSIKLKDTIAMDTVVLELLERFGATFDGQPGRKVCWGLGMDSKFVLFVKCTNDYQMSYSVSSICKLSGEGWDLLLRFLNAGPTLQRYVPVTLPVLWEKKPLSLLSSNVYLLENNIVCKVGSKTEIQREHNMLLCVAKLASFLVPKVGGADIGTGNDGFPCGLQLAWYDVISVKSKSEVVEVASNIFWGLGVLHKLGIVQKDVKPSNILSNPNCPNNSRYLLCDYGALQGWSTKDAMWPATTKEFASIPGTFCDTDNCMYLRDLEALFWSVFAMWLQVVKNCETSSVFRISRQVDLWVLQNQGGSFVGEQDNETLHQPTDPVLQHFLGQQAVAKQLLLPSEVFDLYVDLGVNNLEGFNTKARVDSILPCPPKIYDLVMENKG